MYDFGIPETAEIMPDQKPVTYCIIRVYHPALERRDEIMRTGLTLAEAQAHCKDPLTRKENVFFDSYDKE